MHPLNPAFSKQHCGTLQQCETSSGCCGNIAVALSVHQIFPEGDVEETVRLVLGCPTAIICFKLAYIVLPGLSKVSLIMRVLTNAGHPQLFVTEQEQTSCSELLGNNEYSDNVLGLRVHCYQHSPGYLAQGAQHRGQRREIRTGIVHHDHFNG